MNNREGITSPEQHIAEFKPELIKVIVFDVDETLVHGTTAVKDSVWTKVLFPEQKEEIDRVNQMFDRFLPFPDNIFRQGDRRDRIAYMLGLWIADDDSHREHTEVARLSEVFERSVQNGVRAVSVNEDDIETLRYLKNKMQLHVVSNVPRDVLYANLEHYGIAKYFKTIIGTPVKKPEALQQIIETLKCSPEELLMVGDGNPDHDAAQLVGTQFVSVASEGKKDKWPDEIFPKINSLEALLYLLF